MVAFSWMQGMVRQAQRCCHNHESFKADPTPPGVCARHALFPILDVKSIPNLPPRPSNRLPPHPHDGPASDNLLECRAASPRPQAGSRRCEARLRIPQGPLSRPTSVCIFRVHQEVVTGTGFFNSSRATRNGAESQFRSGLMHVPTVLGALSVTLNTWIPGARLLTEHVPKSALWRR